MSENNYYELFAEALNGPFGPLYVGIAAITFLVFGYGIMEHGYGCQAGGCSLYPYKEDATGTPEANDPNESVT